jgi:cell division protein FtsL
VHSMSESVKGERSSIMRRMIKLTCFFAVLFFLLFCITWQNMHMFTLNRRIDELTEERNDLERSIYLKNMELATLRSRERVKGIATEELGMIPITYKDVKIIVYER